MTKGVVTLEAEWARSYPTGAPLTGRSKSVSLSVCVFTEPTQQGHKQAAVCLATHSLRSIGQQENKLQCSLSMLAASVPLKRRQFSHVANLHKTILIIPVFCLYNDYGLNLFYCVTSDIASRFILFCFWFCGHHFYTLKHKIHDSGTLNNQSNCRIVNYWCCKRKEHGRCSIAIKTRDREVQRFSFA
jgi:hypothetical protein